jgi:hypothetical protein
MRPSFADQFGHFINPASKARFIAILLRLCTGLRLIQDGVRVIRGLKSVKSVVNFP